MSSTGGYFDLARQFSIHTRNAFFIIREKGQPEYEVLAGEGILDGLDGVLID